MHELKLIDTITAIRGQHYHIMKLYRCDVQKIKMTYDCYNGVERCNIEIFNKQEYKFNSVFGLPDLGFIPDSSLYGMGKETVLDKASKCFEIAKKLLNHIL
jgi:hypothetical protein